MFIIISGMIITFFLTLAYLPSNLTFSKIMKIAAANGKLNILDFSLNTKDRYTFWSGITGGFFLALSYFGTDQSQVQRYLSGKSIRESQLGLIFNGIFKIPMQFFILLLGVLVFVFYQFNSAPLNFNPSATNTVLNSVYAKDYKVLQESQIALEAEKKIAQNEFSKALDLKEQALITKTKLKITALNKKDSTNRANAKVLIKKANIAAETNDKDYVFIHFILNNLPVGLIGLLLAVILSAAMSSTASELNALGTITTLDLYIRNRKKKFSDKHYVFTTKAFTLLWGIIAILIAFLANLSDNLIQLINIIGSIFYGNILGLFLMAFFFNYIKENAAFFAAIVTQIIVSILYYKLIHIYPSGEEKLGYLWLNFIGATLVIIIALILEKFNRLLRKPTV